MIVEDMERIWLALAVGKRTRSLLVSWPEIKYSIKKCLSSKQHGYETANQSIVFANE